jgi:hypothetical protein
MHHGRQMWKPLRSLRQQVPQIHRKRHRFSTPYSVGLYVLQHALWLREVHILDSL